MVTKLDWQAIGVIAGICFTIFGIFLTIIWFSFKKWVSSIEKFEEDINLMIKDIKTILDDVRIDLTQNYINYKKMDKHEEENAKQFDIIHTQLRKHSDEITNLKVNIAQNIQSNSGLLKSILDKMN